MSFISLQYIKIQNLKLITIDDIFTNSTYDLGDNNTAIPRERIVGGEWHCDYTI